MHSVQGPSRYWTRSLRVLSAVGALKYDSQFISAALDASRTIRGRPKIIKVMKGVKQFFENMRGEDIIKYIEFIEDTDFINNVNIELKLNPNFIKELFRVNNRKHWKLNSTTCRQTGD